ncbi:cell wall hydrolase [Phenylobacterium sp.]|uniref:cell wall hydrolase n=1 Tax=Phenylobacterium sp. TaxID=1871053 RepID=UPI0035B0552C
MGLLTAGLLHQRERDVSLAKGSAASAASARVVTPVKLTPADTPNLLRDLSPAEALAVNQATPFSKEPILAARPFLLSTPSELDRARALTCLTQAIYYEAGFESLEGRRAVAQVVLNRVRAPDFPNTVCGVVFQGSDLPTGCQFTFTCDGALARAPDPAKFKEAETIAAAALSGQVMKGVGMATHYHTDWVVPYWMSSLTKMTQVGAHIFYRWPGAPGLPAAFREVYAGGEPAGPLLAGLVLAEAAPVAPVAGEPLPQVEIAAPPILPPAPHASRVADAAGAEPQNEGRGERMALVTPPAAPVTSGFQQSESWTPRPTWRAF